MQRFFLVLLLFLTAFIAKEAKAEEYPTVQRAFSILPKRELNKKLLGINAFVNDPRFGTISAQFREVKNVLGLKYVRVLFHWNDQIQPSPSAQPFFGYYDEIAASLPSGVQALVIVNGLPSWMDNPANWINGNPRETFATLWLEKVVKRYAGNRKIKAFQVWNEPNATSDPENSLLALSSNPENYLELLAFANNIIRQNAPKKKIVSAATTGINLNFPATLNYAKALKAGGAESLVDIFAIHVYSERLENFIIPGGVSDFLKSITKPIWVTESGEEGTLNQRDYAQTMWPFLFSITSNIKRLYIYQFTEDSPADTTYGLRNLTPGRFLSDLYLYLRSLKTKRVN